MLGQPAVHRLSPCELGVVSPALVAVSIFSGSVFGRTKAGTSLSVLPGARLDLLDPADGLHCLVEAFGGVDVVGNLVCG